MSTPAARGAADVRRRGQLEDRGRELQRVLPLPAGPPAPQPADAVRPGRGLPGRRARGRAAGWSSPTAARRCRSTAAPRPAAPLCPRRDRGAPDLLLHPLAEPDRLGPPRLRADPPGLAGRARTGARSTATSTSRRPTSGTVDVAGAVEFWDITNKRGLPRRRAAAAGHALAQLDGGALLEPGGLGPRLRPDGAPTATRWTASGRSAAGGPRSRAPRRSACGPGRRRAAGAPPPSVAVPTTADARRARRPEDRRTGRPPPTARSAGGWQLRPRSSRGYRCYLRCRSWP